MPRKFAITSIRRRNLRRTCYLCAVVVGVSANKKTARMRRQKTGLIEACKRVFDKADSPRMAAKEEIIDRAPP